MQASGLKNISSLQNRVHRGQKAYVEACTIVAYRVVLSMY